VELKTGEVRNAYEILVGKSGTKTSLGKSKSRWEENIKMLKKYGARVWI
jgi:hypothetical protein